MENTFGTFDIFMIIFVLVFSIFAASISRKIFRSFFGRDFPVDTLREKLLQHGYTFKSHKQIDENSLPQNIVFNQLWSFLRLYYRKSFYEILVTNNDRKITEIVFLKYYQSSIILLSDKYYFLNSSK